MGHSDKQPKNCSCRGRRLADDLYECLSGDTDCRYRFPFGYGYYCPFPLNEHIERSCGTTSTIGEDDHDK